MSDIKTMKICVTGGRDFKNKKFIFFRLDEIKRIHPSIILIHGGAKGADKLSGDWALERGVKQHIFHAKWDKYGKKAGPIRNNEMLNAGFDYLVAFPGGHGTDHMKAITKKRGIPVWEPEMLSMEQIVERESQYQNSVNNQIKRDLHIALFGNVPVNEEWFEEQFNSGVWEDRINQLTKV